MEYKVEIAGVDYTQYLSLPFNINRKNDSTLMTATLNLVNTKKADKFFQYDEVKITVDNTDLYNFVVATDEIDAVKDAFHTGQFLYNHGVQIIERFKICETYNLPSFSISRHDTSYVSFNYDNISQKSSVQSGAIGESGPVSYLFKTDNKLIAFDINKTPLKFKEIPKIKSLYNSSDTVDNKESIAIALDNPPTITYSRNVYVRTTGMWWWKKDVYEWRDVQLNSFMFRFCVSGTYVKDGKTNDFFYSTHFDTSQTLSFRLFGGHLMPSNIESGKFSIYVEFNPDQPVLARRLYWQATSTDNLRNVPTEDECTLGLNGFLSTLRSNGYYNTRVTLTDIEVKKEVDPLEVKALNYNAGTACEKAFDLVDAIDINSGNSPRFSLDRTKPSYAKLCATPMPEMIFEKNNLAEILRKIGKLFNGIPRITADNKVYYDLLTDVVDNPNHNDDTSLLYTTNSSIQNYATTMVSDVSNLIPSEVEKTYSYWPAKNSWGKYLSADQTAWLCPDNAAIRLDNAKDGGIYRIIEFNIRGWNKSNRSRVAHLIQRKNDVEVFNRIVTKELWNSYSKDIRGMLKADGKTYDGGKSQLRCIYYSPKDFTIILNEISESQRKDFFGNEDAQFSYMYAIKDANDYEYKDNVSFGSFAELKDMEFQVVYIPIINSKYIGEQSNVDGLTKSIQTTYSQEDTNPSDKGFGSVVDTYLKRLGNDDISKNEYIEKLEALPYIGEYMDFNNNRYYCDNLTLTCTPGYINTKINYTKNYNKINEMIANPKDYVQYDIPLNESTRRITNINEYIYIQESMNNDYLDFKGEEDYDLLLRLYLGLDKTTSISLAPVIGLYKSEFDKSSENITPATVMMPFKKFYGANSVKFQMDTYDNYSITSVRGDHKNGDKYYENYVSYVNGIGEVARCKIGLIYTTTNDGTSNNIDSSITSYYPIASNSVLDFNTSYCQFNRYLNIRKDKKEALSFVFNVHAITDIPQLDISDGFTKCIFNELSLVNSKDSTEQLKLYFFRYSADGTVDYQRDVALQKIPVGNVHYITLEASITASGTYDGWVMKKGDTEILRKEHHIEPGDRVGIYYYISARTQKLKTY